MISKIGKLKLKNRVFLAPMHQVNDIAFRILCKKAGAGLTYTGLLNPQTRENLFLEDKPCLQFACNSPKGIEDFIKRYDKRISMYDFNLGCPSLHAKSSKIGYFMSNNFEAIEEILKTIRENTKKPLTIKIRKISEENLKKIIKIAEKYCQAIGVHPRTQEQGYSGIPDIEFARQVKKLTSLPVIYSGNIKTKEEAEERLKEFDFIMLGRICIGNPGIFSDILDKKKKNLKFKDWLKASKKYKPNFSQIKFQALNFTREFKGSSKLRKELSAAKNEKEILAILKEDSN